MSGLLRHGAACVVSLGLPATLCSAAVQSPASDDIRDVTSLLGMDLYLPALLVGLVLLLGGAMLAMANRQHRSSQPTSGAALTAPAGEVPLASSAENGPAVYDELVTLVRCYLETQHGIRASRMTVDEVLRAVSQPEHPLSVQAPLLRELLAFCDHVRFSGLQPTEADHLRCRGLAEQITGCATRQFP